MSSNPSEDRPAPLPPEFADALARSSRRIAPLGSLVLYFPVTGSTNDVAASLAARGAEREGAVVLAAEQTAGRGRRGRAWFSPPGSGLYVSVVLVPGRAQRQPARATLLLTLAAGVALAEGIGTATGLIVDLKWPNDLYVGRRKLGGILAEGLAREGGAGRDVILGYGINMATTAYPPELRNRVTSLEAETGRTVDAALLLVETLAAMAARYRDLLDGRFDAILDAWRRRAPAACGARVGWSGPSGAMSGVTAGIDDDGALLVEVAGRVERIIAGELEWQNL